MQTILGAGGVIGNGLIDVLPKYTDKIKVVSRKPKNGSSNTEIISADLTDFKQTCTAVKGSEIVYLTAGLKYSVPVWEVQWPAIMNNVIDACKKYDAKLVFLDNVYMLGKVDGLMTEDTPTNPCSRKGEIRAKIAEKLMDETKAGNLKGLIARSADFYGPGAANSAFTMLVFEAYSKGKTASWVGNDTVKHSFTYTPDAVIGTALLGNTPDAYNKIWHLPTDKNALTGKELITLTSQAFEVEPKYRVLKKWMLQMVGLFDSNIKETVEMMYQYEYTYLFDSCKFEKQFKFTPASYLDGITITAKSYMK